MCTHNQQLNSLYIFALLSSHHIKKGPNYTMEIRKSYACNYIYYFYILYYCATTTTTIMISLYLRSMIQFLYYSLIEKKILLFLLQFFFQVGKGKQIRIIIKPVFGFKITFPYEKTNNFLKSSRLQFFKSKRAENLIFIPLFRQNLPIILISWMY